MTNFKERLADMLSEAVKYLFSGSVLRRECSQDGFFCDFDLSAPLNPEKISAIERHLAERDISCAYEISGFSGAYEDDDARKKMLQRVYVTAFETNAGLEAHREKLAAAAEHDHKRIGNQLELYSTSDEIGAGLVLWHPKGAVLRYILERFSQNSHMLNDYQWAYTPNIGRAELWKTSGHLDFYKDSMYNPIEIDGEEYYLKPMNCPFHFVIYNSRKRSYRELPMRIAEFGTVYRYELSGALSGLTRVRGFTQDDAHIICTPEQVEREVAFALKFSLYILRSFGLTEFKPYVSTKPPVKSIGPDELWETATEVLKKAVVSCGLEYEIDEGGGAFYGPKIDLKLFDSLGREWQCSTIQFDFNLPERFQMRYVGSDGQSHAPMVVHRALFGSVERFAALLIEHYKGDFPVWFAPTQFAIVPIAQAHNEYCKRLMTQLKIRELRVEMDDSDANMREKIKRFELQKIPYILIVGDRDMAGGVFSVRGRREGNLGAMTLDALEEYIRPALNLGKPKYIVADE